MRHGQSLLNKTNSFGGWIDIDLSNEGIIEAQQAAQLIQNSGFLIDVVYTSQLKRSIKTANIMLEQMNSLWIPQKSTWRLNERHYGILQGMNKKEASFKYGEQQVQLWRRSYSFAPPPTLDGKSESLQDVANRVKPYWEDVIAKDLYYNKIVLLIGHSNSLRSLLYIIKKLDEKQLLELNIPNAAPLIINFDTQLKYISEQYLGNQELILKRIKKVANQGSISK